MSKQDEQGGAGQGGQESTLFPVPEPTFPNNLPGRIRGMLSTYGQTEGQRCGECAHLLAVRYSRTYYKCQRSHMSASNATDWRVSWPACGLFERRTGDTTTIHPPR